MRLVTIPKDSVTYELAKMLKGGEVVAVTESLTFLEWLEELAQSTPEFGKGIKAAKRLRRLTKKLDEAEAEKVAVLKLDDDDWQDMKRLMDKPDFGYSPAKNSAVLEFMEAFESAQEEKGPA